MAWYKVGTISVTNNSTTVEGVGTAWVGAVLRGEGVVMPNGVLYEIDLVNSGTSITLARPYTGPTTSGQSYSICPIQDYIKLLASQAAELVNAVNDTVAGVFGVGSVGLPSIRTAADPNTGLNLLGGDELSLVTGGVDRFKIGPTGTPSGTTSDYLRSRTNHTGTQPVSTIANFTAEVRNAFPELTRVDTDLKTVKLTGFYPVWMPVDSPSGTIGFLEVFTYSADWVVQRYYDIAQPTLSWRRNFYNGDTWSPWILESNQINATRSIASGGIIESGSNANGTYTKFADGTLICNGSIILPATELYALVNAVWVLPKAFVDGTYALQHSTSNVIGAGSIASSGDIVANGVIVYKTAGTCQLNVYTYKFAIPDQVVFSLTAIGRWK